MAQQPLDLHITRREKSFVFDRERVNVTSTNVNWLQYDNVGGILVIEYIGGRRYLYGVSPKVALSAYRAPSKGKWVWANLRVWGMSRLTRKITGRIRWARRKRKR